MACTYLKPMLDGASPRVFNCNELTQRLHHCDPGAEPLFRTASLNHLIIVKDSDLCGEILSNKQMLTGTKIYFPFNTGNVYEGGKTAFLHESGIRHRIRAGIAAGTDDNFDRDMAILRIFDGLPSFDAFLLKDRFESAGIGAHPRYFELPAEQWSDIRSFIARRFEPLVAESRSVPTAWQRVPDAACGRFPAARPSMRMVCAEGGNGSFARGRCRSRSRP